MNADDYGLTPGVCEGILRAHREGIVTSTSVLTPAPAFEAHVGALRDSGLAAGLHLAVVGEDPPLLSASEIPSLVATAVAASPSRGASSWPPPHAARSTPRTSTASSRRSTSG